MDIALFETNRSNNLKVDEHIMLNNSFEKIDFHIDVYVLDPFLNNENGSQTRTQHHTTL